MGQIKFSDLQLSHRKMEVSMLNGDVFYAFFGVVEITVNGYKSAYIWL